ncbi:MAG: FAD-dependent oxidoreductase [Pleurocapsa sp. MO_192.B19]|nr:FAD-dependent oxidoreductase [Pleurocapsa sp. MO_192.B19]
MAKLAKPALFSIDDDPEVLQAIKRDLQQAYGRNYRVLSVNSGKKALEVLQELKLRNQPVALLLVDQRMPHMTGVEFLQKAMELFPEAKRVLLTAYADTDAAIRAINIVKTDYYLQKPWNPPEEHLYPVLNDLLDDWLSKFHPPFAGIRVIGNRWSPKSHRIKDFLGRNQMPYQWLDVDTNEEACDLFNRVSSNSNSARQLPLVLFPDGSQLVEPSNVQIAEKIGLKTQAELPFYDTIVVGAGPAGLAAAVYGASEGLRTLILERHAPGGQAGSSSRIENYLGFPVGLSGGDLARRAVTQAKRFGVEILSPQEVTRVRVEEPYRIVTLADGSELSCRALIVAIGVSYRQLNVPGIKQLYGAGVYYGAAKTEALACKGEEIFIVGGANSAGQAAMFFSQHAEHVTMLVRGDSLAKTMSKYLIDQIEETENISVQLRSSVIEVKGKTSLEAITIANDDTGFVKTVPANSLFIFIGAVPRTDWLEGFVERDERGYILTGSSLKRHGQSCQRWKLGRDPFLLETSVPGVFAVGDVRHNSVKRVASAVGEGSIAIQFIHQYLNFSKV